MSLYLDSGYLNQEWVQKQADKQNISFIVEIGGRQVGKTYGTLELMLDQEKKFILMRRTQTETDFICNDINNPFTVFNRGITVKKDTKYTAAIYRTSEDSNNVFTGSVMALSTTAKIRGFNGSIYTDLVFDEFIPENHVTKIKNEGDAFLNAVVTISGNRELDDLPPLRCWLLANANTISSPILDALNIAEKVESMSAEGKELSIMPERGIMIILPKSEQILNKRKNTALMRAIKKDSRFSKMAVENEFSYNDASNIINVNIDEYKPLCSVIGMFTIWRHKNNATLFVNSKYIKTHCNFADTERERVAMHRVFPFLRGMYFNGTIFFSDLVTKGKFETYCIN